MADPNEGAPLLSAEKTGMVVYSTMILANNCYVCGVCHERFRLEHSVISVI